MHRPVRKLLAAAGIAVGLTAPVVAATSAAESPTLSAAQSVQATGYWMVDVDGRVYEFGTAANFPDSTGTSPVVKLAPHPSGGGYWVLREDGSVTARGTAVDFGSAVQIPAGQVAATMAPTPSGNGYWIFTDFGRVFTFGDAQFFSDTRDIALQGRIIDSIPTPTGLGYYMVAVDGGVFAFGDATFSGSVPGVLQPGQRLNSPVNGLVPDPDGKGYWLVAGDGGVFAFEADFAGALPGILANLGATLNAPIIGMVAYGDAYLMVASDGGIFNFATDLQFLGSLGGQSIPAAISSVAITPADTTTPTTTTTTTTTIPPTTTTQPVAANPTRISVTSTGLQADGASSDPDVTADGRYSVFRSAAVNLDAADNNLTATDIYRHDSTTGETIRVSAIDGSPTIRTAPNGPSREPAISADGNLVVFSSIARNLLAEHEDAADRDFDIFVRDVAAGTTERITRADADGNSGEPDISADGRFVVFRSDASNLVAGDTNGVSDIFLHDRTTTTTTRLTTGNGASAQPAISPDGSFVVFTSAATDLVANDTNGQTDVFIASITTGVVINRVSVDATGIEGNGLSDQPDVSSGGSFVVFKSAASNLVLGDTNLAPDVFLKNVATGAVTRMSSEPAGAPTNDTSYRPVISADGSTVAYFSDASDIVAGDVDDTRDVFLFDRATGINRLITSLTSTDPKVAPNHAPAISANGGIVVFQSRATALVANDTNGVLDVFRYVVTP